MARACNMGLLLSLADVLIINIGSAIWLLLRQDVHRSSFVYIFGIGFVIGLTFGLKEHRMPAQQQALNRWQKFNRNTT